MGRPRPGGQGKKSGTGGKKGKKRRKIRRRKVGGKIKHPSQRKARKEQKKEANHEGKIKKSKSQKGRMIKDREGQGQEDKGRSQERVERKAKRSVRIRRGQMGPDLRHQVEMEEIHRTSASPTWL